MFTDANGGGYTFKAAQTDKRLKAVATLSLFNSGEVRREGFRGCQVDSIQERLAAASKARQDEADGKNAALTPNMCETATPEQADAMPYDLYREGYYYYGRDAAHEGSTFSYTVSSLMKLAAWDAPRGRAHQRAAAYDDGKPCRYGVHDHRLLRGDRERSRARDLRDPGSDPHPDLLEAGLCFPGCGQARRVLRKQPLGSE